LTQAAPTELPGTFPRVDIDDLLQKTSRTFALAIPLLDEPTRRPVSLAYLLMRIVDTFEDAASWPKPRRLEALRRVGSLLREAPPQWADGALRLVQSAEMEPLPTTHPGYLELLHDAPLVFHAVSELPEPPRSAICTATSTMAAGMARFVAKADDTGRLTLVDLGELQAYCYFAAGVVGQLLTELFLLDAPQLLPASAELRRTMVAFGEGLQLVNILKDAADDTKDGRSFLPASVSRDEVFELARADLVEAGRYVDALQAHDAPRGMLTFTGISLLLAWRTLQALEERAPKLTRAEVGTTLAALCDTIDRRLPVGSLLERR
jgi:farnesyl-diphosphate farnesyltransferase